MDTTDRKPARSKKKLLLFALKLAFSAAMLFVIFEKVLNREGAEGLSERLGNLSWGWVIGAVGMQLTAIGFSTVRWQRLLVGQGIRATWRFLVGSIMIARFWGAFTPGGFTGFGGWRIYDVAVRTGKTARATATIGVEMILGQLAFGVVVMAGSVFGLRFIGIEGVLLVNGFFVGLIAVGVLFLSRPALFRYFARWLPSSVRLRVQTLVDAVCAYQGKGWLLVQAAVLGMGTHAFNNLIYVCAARALGVELGVGEVFFASSLQIFATLIPASINGIGLREAAAVALYTSPLVGLPIEVAVLIPVVGFAAEMAVSSVGGLIFVARRTGYAPRIEVDDADREQKAHEAIPVVAPELRPRPLRGLTIGLGAGLLAGVIVGLAEAGVVMVSAAGSTGLGVLTYGAAAYGLFGAVCGAGLGLTLAAFRRALQMEAMAEPLAYARITAFLVAILTLAIGAFRVRRDYFHEELVWKGPKGLLVMLGCVAAAVVIYLLLSAALRLVLTRRPGKVMLRAWGSPVVVGAFVAALAAATLLDGQPANAALGDARATPPGDASNVLVIVVDTLRADHLPGYGYEGIATPNLDAFAQDAIRFDQAFANSSWTRPSFATILTGRYSTNHGVMSKSDSLPDELVTLPEALRAAGWYTAGVATNFNVAPYFNFHQGFDEYRYLEPEFVLGADDTAAKLLLVQFLRQRIEKWRAVRGEVLPGTAYRDAQTVNAEIGAFLDRAPRAPWMLFVGYMDPHDPYFEHPYDGSGYARAAHQRPGVEEATELTRLYDGEIVYWDAQLGRLLGDLRRRGLYDDMTIVIMADHGEELADHGGFWHGTTLYDEQVRIPMYFKLPQSVRGGTVVRHWVQTVDVMPTLLQRAGVPTPHGVQGGDMFQGTDTVYAWESHEGNNLESIRERRGTDEHKIITANPGNPRGLAPVELFRVDEDPGERRDLSTERPDDLRTSMEALLEARRSSREGAVQSRSVQMDEESEQRLRNLGYVGEH